MNTRSFIDVIIKIHRRYLRYRTYGRYCVYPTGRPWYRVCPHELRSPGMLLASLGFICMPRGIHYRAQARRMMLRPGIVEGIAMRFVVGDGGASQRALAEESALHGDILFVDCPEGGGYVKTQSTNQISRRFSDHG